MKPYPVRILFLARRYPPSIGGIQTHCHRLFTHLQRTHPITLIALGRDSLLHLCWFLPWVGLRTWLALLCGRVDAVYFGDGVVCALAPLLRPFRRRARFFVTIYGLEMTYRSSLAQALMKWGARCCERIVVISENSRQLAVEWGLPAERMEIVYVGVEPPVPDANRLDQLRSVFENKHGVRFGSTRVLLNIGRQVERKGLAAFLEQGFPLLEEDLYFVIAGGGPELARLRQLRGHLEAGDRIVIVESPDDDMAAMLRSSCDLFLMPNIPLAGDVEGYGITPLESMFAETPVIAFAVDALVESIREGGYLVPSGDYGAFADQIHEFFSLSRAQQADEGRRARHYVLREYSWDTSARQYAEIFAGNLNFSQ